MYVYHIGASIVTVTSLLGLLLRLFRVIGFKLFAWQAAGDRYRDNNGVTNLPVPLA
jgi:hypothetical protein